MRKTRKNDFYRTKINSDKILKIRVDGVSLKKALSLIEKWVESNKQYQITTPNPEHIVLAQSDYRFRNIINNSALALPDGIGLVWAVKLLKGDKLHRLSGADLMLEMCKLAAEKNWRVFLLGGKRAAKIAALKLKAPRQRAGRQSSKLNLNISYFDGAVDINNETIKERNKAIKKINNFKPHFLFVAYGAPMQEKWIAENLSNLKVKVGMGVGGAFDYLSGRIKRAPKVIQKLNLEWFWRLIYEPWRWKRQLRLLKFIYLVLKQSLITNH